MRAKLLVSNAMGWLMIPLQVSSHTWLEMVIMRYLLISVATWYYTFNLSTSIVGEKERVVAFVSFGYMHTQVMVCAFKKTNIRMLSTKSDPNLGGWHIDQIIYDKMRERYNAEFQTEVSVCSFDVLLYISCRSSQNPIWLCASEISV